MGNSTSLSELGYEYKFGYKDGVKATVIELYDFYKSHSTRSFETRLSELYVQYTAQTSPLEDL